MTLQELPDASAPPGGRRAGELGAVLGVWLALAAILVGLTAENTLLPGLYYDEAVFGGLARDFVAGPAHGRHMPNTGVVQVFGRPFPVFHANAAYEFRGPFIAGCSSRSPSRMTPSRVTGVCLDFR